MTSESHMEKLVKLTPDLLQQIINEERKKLETQKLKIKEVKQQKRVGVLRKEVKTLLQLIKEQKVLVERLKNLHTRTDSIKKKIKES